MHLCLHLSLLEPKKMLILNINGVLCYFLHLVILQGNAKVFGKMLTRPKWKLELEWKIFLLWHFKSFMSQFGLVWNLRMCCKFPNAHAWKFVGFVCFHLAIIWTMLQDIQWNFTQVSLLLKGFACIIVVVGYLMGRKIKHY
jgi:hypothetical protein